MWRFDWNGKKWKKPPHSAKSGRKADINNPAQHAPMEQAQATYTRGGWDGIGIVLTEKDDLAVGDLDDCIDAAGNIDPQARAIVEALDSYTEVSPSGEGLRVILLGKLPPGGCRRGKLELYDSGRYVTITGHHLPGTPTTVEARQSALEQVHAAHIAPTAPTPAPAPRAPHRAPHSAPASDSEMLDRALNARNGAKFAALWRGETSDYGDDHSGADLALCNMLAYWSDCDAGAMDRLFRRSGLYRPEKWDTVHRPADGATYGQMTIEEAIDGTPRRKVDAASALPADSDLAAQLQAAHARIAHLEAERETMRRVLRQKGYRESRRVLLANVLLDAKPDPDIDGWQRCDHATVDKLAERYGMRPGTVRTALQELEKGGIVERQMERRYTDDRGRALPHPLTDNILLFVPGPAQLELSELPTVARTEAARNSAAEVRKLARQAQQAACPECGETGLTLACHHCGCVVEAGDDPDEGRQTLPTLLDTLGKVCLPPPPRRIHSIHRGGG